MASEALLRRLRVLAFAEESTEGTFLPDLQSNPANYATVAVINPTYSITPLTFDREVARAAFTKLPPKVAGASQIEISFEVELAGLTANVGTAASGDFSAGLSMATLFAACGLAETAVDRVTLDVVSGNTVGIANFQNGESVSATGGETGTVVGTTHNTWSGLYLTGLGADPIDDTDTITGGTSGASASADGASTGTRYAYTPQSTLASVPTLSMSLFKDGKVVKAKGCRGTFSLNAAFGNSVRIQFTFRGVLHVAEADEAAPTGTFADEIPPSFIGANLRMIENQSLTNKGALLNHNAVTIDYGNELVVRENASISSGFTCAVINDRNPTLRVNPDELKVADSDWINLWDRFIQGDPIAMAWDFGTVVGNRFGISAPGCVATAVTDAERDGIDSFDGTFRLTSGINTDGSTDQENEFALFYY